MLGPITVIINASAGLGYQSDWTEQLRGKLEAPGFAVTLKLAHSGAEMVAAAEQALGEGATMVVAGGGDGTINAVASVLVGSGVRFGVLPLGTLNHFAKDMKIPLALDEAIANLVHGQPCQVDVGEVNGSIFLNNSSLGLYPDIVRQREQLQRKLGQGKWPAFGRALVASLRRYPFLNVKLKVNGDAHVRRTPFVFIGNNEYRMQGLNPGVRARLDGGMLSLYVAQRPTRLGLLRLAFHALRGRLSEAKDFDVLLARELVIETHHKRLRVATDGEVSIMHPPLCYRSLPAALAVMVPPGVAAEADASKAAGIDAYGADASASAGVAATARTPAASSRSAAPA
ncbi:diacylglycerol kinase family protein [Rugamonas sp. DEMB1]|uniref:diacylglycerol/lipid kinase family protein n=1 Tax=Rugamonas sp. DEMB1 TaxID=3039386 RepID=UPI00244D4D2D|nr:diacylglycerol kinase family protein [Rugamonas sp. DEMB1]WGG48811.1 diacylglycerol kinase family lipid kinase [Rugamonas sp. DEMB1]